MRKIIAISSVILSACMLFGCGFPVKSRLPASSESAQQPDTEKRLREATQTLKLPFDGTGSHVLIGDTLYFTASADNKPTADYAHLVEYDIKTGKHRILYTSEHQEPRMQALSVNENWLIWNDINAWGAGLKVCVLNRKNGKIKELPIEEKPSDKKIICHSLPSLDDNYVYMTQGESGKPFDVCEFDLKNDTHRIITRVINAGKLSSDIAAKDGKVVWLDHVDAKPHYMVYDRDTGKTQSYLAQHIYIDGLKLAGDIVFSRNTDDKYNSDYYEIDAFNLKTEQFLSGLPTTGWFRVTEDYLVSQINGLHIYKINPNETVLTDTANIKSDPDWTVNQNNMLITTTDSIKKNGKPRGYSEIKIIALDKL